MMVPSRKPLLKAGLKGSLPSLILNNTFKTMLLTTLVTRCFLKNSLVSCRPPYLSDESGSLIDNNYCIIKYYRQFYDMAEFFVYHLLFFLLNFKIDTSNY